MPNIELKPAPEPIPRMNFSQLRQVFQNIGIKVVKGAFQSLNFVELVSGWQLTNISASFFTGTFNIGGTNITINNTVDVQETLDTVETAGGGTVFLQNGTYTLTADLSIPSGVTLQGVSRDGVIIDCDGTWAVKIVGTNVYSTGTVTLNNGDTTVVGSGTTWTAAMIGRSILLDGLWYEITARADNTHITIDTHQGVNLAGSAYVLSTINTTGVLNKVTVTGATGSGVVAQYAMEPQLFDIVTSDCGTGIEMDYVVFPAIRCTANGNGVNLNMNFVEGFSIDFSEFNFSTTGAGVIMTDTRNSTFADFSVNDNTADGINMTSCTKIAFISFDISGNGGQGVEAVSGCNDNQFIGGILDGNTSDNIKLTATSDRNQFVAVSSINSGAYGINIAASTCDNNVINSPTFSGNSSGNINDSGTLTVIIADDTAYGSSWNGNLGTPTKNAVYDKIETIPVPFIFQDIPLNLGTGTPVNYTCAVTSNPTGTVLYFCYALSSATTTLNIGRMAKDTLTGNFYITHTTTLTFTAAALCGVAVVGSFVYVSTQIGGVDALRRYAAADLSGVTTFTFSGTSRSGNCWSDGTNLYIHEITNEYDKFTLSGTTATNAATLTYTSAGGVLKGIGDASNLYVVNLAGTNFFQPGGAITFNRYAKAGGAATSSLTPVIIGATAYDGMNVSNVTLFMGGATQLGIAFPYNLSTASAVKNTILRLMAITLP